MMSRSFFKEYLLKIIILLGFQALSYFIIKSFLGNLNIIAIDLDNKIPFIMNFIWIYNLWFPFLVIGSYFIFKHDKKAFNIFFYTSLIGVLISNIIFLVYPTMVIRPTVEITNLTSLLVSLTYKGDTPVNCLPSIHCLLSFTIMFSVLFSNTLKYIKIIISIISILIVLSTLFVKQHVILDAVSAFVIAIITYIIVKKIIKK